MDEETKNTLELFDRFLTNSCARPLIAADRLSCIMGVVIGVKPACMIDFTEKDTEGMDMKVFESFLTSLGLEFIYDKTELNPEIEPSYTNTYFISKEKRTARMLFDTEHELYDHFDTDEPNAPIIKIIHRKIGRLLGYPETATDWFLIRQEKLDLDELENDEIYKDLQSFYHFIHSRNNSDEEFEEYDKPIHEAMEKYTPLSAKLMRDNAGTKRWL